MDVAVLVLTGSLVGVGDVLPEAEYSSVYVLVEVSGGKWVGDGKRVAVRVVLLEKEVVRDSVFFHVSVSSCVFVIVAASEVDHDRVSSFDGLSVLAALSDAETESVSAVVRVRVPSDIVWVIEKLSLYVTVRCLKVIDGDNDVDGEVRNVNESGADGDADTVAVVSPDVDAELDASTVCVPDGLSDCVRSAETVTVHEREDVRVGGGVIVALRVAVRDADIDGEIRDVSVNVSTAERVNERFVVSDSVAVRV